MPIPAFIHKLRARIGTELLFLPGVVAVVFDDEGRVLLGRRADTGCWALISGIPDPGEQPAECAVREVYEETAVHAVPERIVSVCASRPVSYPNGDRAQYMDIVLRCRAIGGQARVNDDESLDVGWFALDALPDVSERVVADIKHALSDGPTWFEPAAPVTAGTDGEAEGNTGPGG